MKTFSSSRILDNERGLLTLDVVFSLVLVCGVGVVLFALSFTLTAVEVAQYVAFSTSRDYYAADVSEDAQKEAAQAKYAELMGAASGSLPTKGNGVNQVLKKSWFEIEPNWGKFADIYDAEDDINAENFVGSRFSLISKLLNIEIPFFGETAGNSKAFQTFITSFIGREPTQNECISFYQNRWAAIATATGGIGQAPENPIVEDNGC